MNRKRALLSALFLVFALSISAQQYTARGYWLMEHDSTYLNLSSLQSAGAVLSPVDQARLEEHKSKLTMYFAQMSDEEKAIYYKSRSEWAAKPGSVYQEVEQVYSGQRSTFTKYVTASGLYGLMYGAAGIYILGLESDAAAGLPFVTGGISVLLPLVTIKDKAVTTNSLLLALHGKAIGAFQGAMLGVAITGDQNSDDQWGKLVAGLATASSITLGHVGYAMGKKSNWTPGKVSLFTHYGWLIPLESMALVGAFGVESPRVYGLTSLVGGAGGYLLANNIAKRRDFTRGDVFSIQTFTWLNAGLGIGIAADITDNSDAGSAIILIPAATAMAGDLIGQAWMKNAKLTNQQGRNVILATTAGSVIGLGLSTMISGGEVSTIDYVIPYVTGLITYSVIAESYRKRNNSGSFAKEALNGWKINFAPQNIWLNNRIASTGHLSGSRMSLLPAFSASVTF